MYRKIKKKKRNENEYQRKKATTAVVDTMTRSSDDCTDDECENQKIYQTES